jgi:hypothetical protein
MFANLHCLPADYTFDYTLKYASNGAAPITLKLSPASPNINRELAEMVVNSPELVEKSGVEVPKGFLLACVRGWDLDEEFNEESLKEFVDAVTFPVKNEILSAALSHEPVFDVKK